MRKTTILLASLFLCLLAQAQEQAFRVEGILPDNSCDKRTIYLVKRDLFDYEKMVVLDSAQVKENRFSLKGSVNEEPQEASVEFATMLPTDLFCLSQQTLFLEPGVITVTYDSLGATVTGTPVNERYNELLLKENRRIREQTNRIVAERDAKERQGSLSNEEREQYSLKLRELYVPYRSLHNQFVRENIHNAAGAALFFRFPLESYEEADRLFLTQNVDPLLLKAYQEKEERKRQEQEYFQNSQKQMSEGHRYREVEGMDPKGNAVRLSDYVKPGRVLLIDFWASWCGPCVMEIPFLKDLYQKYHAKGLDIVSISLDTSKAAWLRALEKQDMEWPQMSDLKGWKGQAPKDYGVAAIPFVLLLDKNGYIVMRNLHDHLLVKAVEEALK